MGEKLEYAKQQGYFLPIPIGKDVQAYPGEKMLRHIQCVEDHEEGNVGRRQNYELYYPE